VRWEEGENEGSGGGARRKCKSNPLVSPPHPLSLPPETLLKKKPKNITPAWNVSIQTVAFNLKIHFFFINLVISVN
jgi:hypothetical protein